MTNAKPNHAAQRRASDPRWEQYGQEILSSGWYFHTNKKTRKKTSVSQPIVPKNVQGPFPSRRNFVELLPTPSKSRGAGSHAEHRRRSRARERNRHHYLCIIRRKWLYTATRRAGHENTPGKEERACVAPPQPHIPEAAPSMLYPGQHKNETVTFESEKSLCGTQFRRRCSGQSANCVPRNLCYRHVGSNRVLRRLIQLPPRATASSPLTPGTAPKTLSSWRSRPSKRLMFCSRRPWQISVTTRPPVDRQWCIKAIDSMLAKLDKKSLQENKNTHPPHVYMQESQYWRRGGTTNKIRIGFSFWGSRVRRVPSSVCSCGAAAATARRQATAGAHNPLIVSPHRKRGGPTKKPPRGGRGNRKQANTVQLETRRIPIPEKR